MGTGRARPSQKKNFGVHSKTSQRKKVVAGKLTRLQKLARELSKKQGTRVRVQKGK